MAQEAISASSKYWDGKSISLTENTKKNILKKAYALDAETMFAQYNLDSDAAVDAAEQNGVTQEQLVQNPNSYTYLGASAIADLENNASKESRVEAIQKITQLGFTNIYESNTKNFITPPEEPAEEKPKPEPEEPPTYQYKRRTIQQEEYQPSYTEPAPSPEPRASPRATLQGAARFIPNAVRQNIPQRGSGVDRLSVRSRPVARPTQNFTMNKPQPMARPTQAQRPLLNPNVAAKLGGKRIDTVSNERKSVVNPRPTSTVRKFGLGVRRQ